MKTYITSERNSFARTGWLPAIRPTRVLSSRLILGGPEVTEAELAEFHDMFGWSVERLRKTARAMGMTVIENRDVSHEGQCGNKEAA